MYPLKEYSDLVKMIENDENSRDTLYQELINKEKNVLDVISRLATQEDGKTTRNNLFINITVQEAIGRFANTWNNIFQELIEASSSFDHIKALDLRAVFIHEDRKIYVGFTLLIVAMLLFFISVTQ
jgi:hypothetical protein